MNSKFVLVICFLTTLLTVGIVLLGMTVYTLRKDLKQTQTFLSDEISASKTTELKLLESFTKIESISEQISILDESISPSDKRWAKVKKIRKAVTDVIRENGYIKVPDVNGLTSYASAVVDFSEQYDVPIPLILAVTTRESAFNVSAVSHAGAHGLMQLMSETAKECANDINKPFFNVYKIRDNVQLGTWYLYKVLDIFNGDVDLSVRAYNAGPTYVKKVLAGELPDYPKETIEYHKAVLEWKKKYENFGL